jgi:hypothetical protein
MAETFLKIASSTVGAGGASNIIFSNIPSTFTDLCVKSSLRSTAGGFDDYLSIRFNSDTGNNYKNIYLQAYASSAASGGIGTSYSSVTAGFGNGTASTANAFSSNEIYIANYASNQFKTANIDSFLPNNSTSEYVIRGTANQWLSTSAITSITMFLVTGNLAQYSTATLYGIVKP